MAQYKGERGFSGIPGCLSIFELFNSEETRYITFFLTKFFLLKVINSNRL